MTMAAAATALIVRLMKYVNTELAPLNFHCNYRWRRAGECDIKTGENGAPRKMAGKRESLPTPVPAPLRLKTYRLSFDIFI